MSFWRDETLRVELPKLIQPFDAGSIDCAAYHLHLGSEVYVSPVASTDPSRHTKLILEPHAGLPIPPGQFALLMTEEIVTIPGNCLGLISIRAKVKLRGLVNVSGFHVDPGWSGKLVFAVFNASPSTVHLAQGEPCFLLWIADLDGDSKKLKGPGFTTLESGLISRLSGEMQSLSNLASEIKALDVKTTERIHRVERELYAWRVVGGLIAGAVLTALVTIMMLVVERAITPLPPVPPPPSLGAPAR